MFNKSEKSSCSQLVQNSANSSQLVKYIADPKSEVSAKHIEIKLGRSRHVHEKQLQL